MIILLSGLIILVLWSIGATFHAVITAKDGFENEAGFHARQRVPAVVEQPVVSDAAEKFSGSSTLPPMLPSH